MGQVFRLFPKGDPVGHDSDQAHPQAVFHRADGIRKNGQPGGFVLHVGAEALGVQTGQIILQRAVAVVEIVISQRHKVILPLVQRIRHGQGKVMAVAVIGQRRALNGISAVDDQRVSILGKAHGKQPHGTGLLITEIVGIQITVRIRGEVNRQSCCHA